MSNKDKRSGNRSKLDASHGNDEIEIEKNEGKRMDDMDKFLPMDGDLGDESMDYDALPDEIKKNHNYYDATLSTGGSERNEHQKNEIDNQGIHVAEAGEAGIAFNEDKYVDEDGEIDVAEEKRRKNKKD